MNAASTAAYCGDLRPHPVELGVTPVVLADRLAFCRFAYHPPYDGFSYQEIPWVNVWDAQYPKLPAGVRVEMKSAAPLIGLPVVSLTIPLRADRNPLAQYADTF